MGEEKNETKGMNKDIIQIISNVYETKVQRIKTFYRLTVVCVPCTEIVLCYLEIHHFLFLAIDKVR